MTAVRSLFRRDPEVWTVLSLMVLANVTLIAIVSHGWLRPGIYIFGRFLLLGAVLAAGVFLFRGWRAPFQLLKPMTVWRFNPLWIPFVIAWPQALSALTLAIIAIARGGDFSAFDRVTTELAFHRHIFPNIVVGAFVGEIVWVGYAIARLRRYMTTYVAALVVGLFWAGWWMPAVFYGVGVIKGLPPLGLVFSQTAVAVMCGFVYARTGSGWVVLALQISANASFLIFPVSPETGDMSAYLLYGAIYFAGATCLYLRFGPRPLFRFAPGEASAR